jgi:hypothetical protein
MGFAEMWAFSYAPTNSIGATQLTHGLRNQGDRGFSFSYNSTTKTITITTTSNVWGGIVVLMV